MAHVLEVLSSVTGWLSDNEAVYLNTMAAQVQAPNVIVEIGSFQGKSTIALALNSSVPVYAIDPHHDHTDEIGGVFGSSDRARFAENIVAAGVHERVCPVNLTSNEAYSGFNHPVGLLFIDGGHNFNQVRDDVFGWGSYLIAGGLLCIHDRTWSDIERVLDMLNMPDCPLCLNRLPDCDSMAVYEVKR